jgi:polysaccharide biosynthesis protein PslH
LVLLAPIVPAPTGNGLAMRVAMQLASLSEAHDVRLVVVPVAGGRTDTAWAERNATSVAVLAPGDRDALRSGTVELVSNARWRARLRRCEPLPHAAALAGPGMMGAAATAAGDPLGARVHACRAYLAPLAVAVAERLGASRVTLDLDDDDERFFDALGVHEEARAYERLVATFGPEFAWVALAAPVEAQAIASRHGLRTVVLPNAVQVGSVRSSQRRDHAALRLLFVGNLSYGPNVEAAEILVLEVLPALRHLLAQDVLVELVGGHEPAGSVAALGAVAGVELSGYVDDLQAAYARADVVVAPLRESAGTRIKLLEAFAAGVPVVTTAAGAAGLPVSDGHEVLLGESPAELADAIARLVADPIITANIAGAARALVVRAFSWEVVGRRLRELVSEPQAPS